MSILITFIKLLAVFDLLVIAAYFGRDILSTVWSKFRKKPRREEPFDFSLDAAAVPLSIDSIRQLYSGDAADFVEERLLPNAQLPYNYKISYLLFDGLLTLVILTTFRVSLIIVYDFLLDWVNKKNTRILIYGTNEESVALKLRLRDLLLQFCQVHCTQL